MLRGMSAGWIRLALVLMIGLGLGAWGMRLYYDRTLRRWDPAQRFVAQLDADLGLDEEQKERVALVLAEQKARMEVRRHGWELDVRLLGRQGEDAISGLLKADQAKRFSRLHDQIHGRMERFLWASDAAPSAVAAGGAER